MQPRVRRRFDRKNRKRGEGIERLPGDKIGADVPSKKREKRKNIRQIKRRERIMSNGNGSNKIMVPNAREAMNKFKMEAANEVDVPSSY